MKAVYSSTNDPMYDFFIPIVNLCWNKLGVDSIIFIPTGFSDTERFDLIFKNTRNCYYTAFDCPKDKEATYAQCSRLFASALGMDKTEVLITTDVDMVPFQGLYNWLFPKDHTVIKLEILGIDLTPDNQYPMCFAQAAAGVWRRLMNTHNLSVQRCLDNALAEIECENFRGNMWSRDQELLFNHAQKEEKILYKRARPGTQFATYRVDRDDTNWRAYTGASLIDAHLWRPGYTEENFEKIMELLQTQYPEDNFDWVRTYRNEYIKLL